MQPAPAATLPFDPAPQNTRRGSVDRGFADLVARDEPPAKTERPRAETAKAQRQEPPAGTRARPSPDPDEPVERGTIAGDESSGRDAAMADAAADPAKASPDPEATAAAAMPAPDATPAAPTRTAGPGVAQPAESSDAVAAVAEKTPATAKIGHSAPAGSPAPTDDNGDITLPAPGPAESRKSGEATQGSGEQIATRSQTEGAIASPSPVQAQTASTTAASGAPRTAGAARDNTGAAIPAGPASPDASAAGAATGTDGDPSGGPPQDGDGVTAMAGERGAGQNKGQEQAVAARGVPAQDAVPAANARAGATDILAAGGETGQRPDAPATAQGHAASPSTSFGNELRAATGAIPSPDAAARMPSGPVVDQMAVQISRAVSEGQDKLTIDLRPAVLGRVSVSLELGHDHRVIAVISADRAETLELMQRDVRGLERALQDAGLKTDLGSLSFNLNGDGAKKSPFSDGANAEPLFVAQPSDDDGTRTAAINPYARVLSPTGVDIHV